MIAKSDLIILTLSTAALVTGIYRWQHATSVVPSVTIAASAREGRVPVPPTGPVTVVRLPAQTTGTAAPPPVPSSDSAPVVTRLPAEDAVGASGVANATASTLPAAGPATGSEAQAAASYGTYRVRSGDYLGRIAQRFDTSVPALRELNGIRGSTIQVGQAIRYPLP